MGLVLNSYGPVLVKPIKGISCSLFKIGGFFCNFPSLNKIRIPNPPIQISNFTVEISIKSMASTGVKGFFREKKKGKPGAAKKSNKSASFGSDVVQPPALISHATLDLQGNLLSYYASFTQSYCSFVCNQTIA